MASEDKDRAQPRQRKRKCTSADDAARSMFVDSEQKTSDHATNILGPTSKTSSADAGSPFRSCMVPRDKSGAQPPPRKKQRTPSSDSSISMVSPGEKEPDDGKSDCGQNPAPRNSGSTFAADAGKGKTPARQESLKSEYGKNVCSMQSAARMREKTSAAATERRISPANQERCTLSRQAESRRKTKESRAMVLAELPGPGPWKVSENSIMLQVSERIKALEIEHNLLADRLERLQKLQSTTECNGEEQSNKLSVEDHNAATGSAIEDSHVVPATDQAMDGYATLRSVLPQPSNAKGAGFWNAVRQYVKDLKGDIQQVKTKTVEIGRQKHDGGPSMQFN